MAVSSHGIIIKRNGIPINEVKDTTPPALTRKSKDITKVLSSDDAYNLGIRRSGILTFVLNWLTETDDTQQGLLDAWEDGSLDTYELDFADGGVWTFTGRVVQFAGKDPVDGVLEAMVAVQVSGGVNAGLAPLVPDDLILLEDGTPLLLENGDYLELE